MEKIRLSKLMSEQGLCSRREADSYIARGWVLVDGVRITELGTRILPSQKITLDKSAQAKQGARVTILLSKPIGFVSSQAEKGYKPAVRRSAPSRAIVMTNQKHSFSPAHLMGLARRPARYRLLGLLVLTQDGRIAKQLIGEDSEIEKEYLVRVEGKLSAAGLKLLNHGLSLDDEALKPAVVSWQNEDQLCFVLKQGKKRQIRRMCELVGLKVVGLKRIRIGRVKLGDLPIGKWRYLGENERF